MNNKRLLPVILILTLLICVFPVTASATEYTPADGETMDISACVSGDVITVGAGRSVILNGNSVNLTSVRITCEAGVILTLQNVVINNSASSGVCPLTFTGAGSRLILESGATSTLTGGTSAPGISLEAPAELSLENNGVLTATGGTGCAGLQCPIGATLTVSGDGTLNATGKNGGAGIGGAYKAACGSITINSGTVIATGGGVRMTNRFYHAIDGGVITISGGTVNSANITYGGIGGNSNEGSSISIAGGTVTATGAPEAIGIGGVGTLGCDVTITGGTVTAISNKVAPIGRNNTSLSGTVKITGGTVTAQSNGYNYAGIDCSYGASGIVTITGGTVKATGGNIGAGICGSGFDYSGSAAGTGTVTISGGTVTAIGGTAGVGICGSAAGTGSVSIAGGTVYAGGVTCDLGSGLADTEETLSITGSAMVFMKNNICTTPTTTTHTNFTYPIGTAEVYGVGISVPDTWTTDFGAYLQPCTLSYDVNGGIGAVPGSVTRLYNTEITLPDGSGLSLAGHYFDGWNTASDGTGTNYAAGANYTMPAGGGTLYAQWTADALTGTATIDDITPEFGQTLTASLADGNNTGTLSYQWKRGAANVGTNSATYTLAADDIGQTITVTISSSVETGTQTSVATAAVTKAASSPATGITPVLSSKTTMSITVTSVTGYEYVITGDGVAINDADWQDSNEFTGLSANTAYDIFQRVKETDTNFASAASSVLDVMTSTNALTGTAGITGDAVFGQTLTASLADGNNTGTLSYQWTRDGVDIGSPTTSNTYTIVQADIDTVIAVKITSSVETGTQTSVATAAVTKAASSPATGITPVLSSKTTTSITVTSVTGYEYVITEDGAAVGTGTWQDSNEFSGLSANTAYDIYQRVKETATHKASGISAKLDVTTNAAPTYMASVSPTSRVFMAVGAGYGVQTAQVFTITNDGSGTITGLSATLGGSYFEISSELSATAINAAGTATVSVRPITGLATNTYTDILTITADNGISLKVPLSFTVLAPTIDPASRDYDLNKPVDVTATITWNGATSITDAVYSIRPDAVMHTLDIDDYTIAGNVLTIDNSFFEGIPLTTGAAVDFVFTFDTGDEAAMTVNVVCGFVPVTGISDVPDTATVGTPLTLTGTVSPANATNRAIIWSVYNAGDTGASIAGNILSTTAAGAVVVQAKIINGTAESTDYTQHFNITVSAAPVTTYTVTFNSNGSTYATKTVNAGESIGTAAWPANPTRSSYTFDGWFTGENGTGTEFTSTTSVNATMTVYAKWSYSEGGSETTPTPTEKTITVTETSSELFKNAPGAITAEANMDNAFSNSIEVKVMDTPEDKASFGMRMTDEVYPFDISLYIKGTNQKTEPMPGYAVTISLPIPENLLDKKEILTIVHKSDSGVVTEIKSRYVQKNGVWYLVFEATEFSPYALVVRTGENYYESAGVPYYLGTNGNRVFIGFAANSKYIAPKGVTVSVMQNDKNLTDITGHWAAGYIGFVTEREIFVGTGGNTFSPDAGMTRAMFATVIGRLYERSYGEIKASSTNAFNDCDYSAYYGKYIAWVSKNSIIEGVGDGKFAPDTLITREQMAAALYRFADFLNVLPDDMDTALNYPDANSISGYAKTAALYCQTTGVIDGRTGGVFAPREAATRAEVATIIQRFVEVVMK
ncbi:MAG TPA: S-layer homology domain-containing protein [Clostridia bacterium]|nr:S-layer homology domain-containing protein [Clostridia bacterium]